MNERPAVPGAAAASPATIRRASPADVPALARFAARTFFEAYAGGVTPADLELYIARAYGDAQQTAELADPNNAYFLAEAGGALAAYALLRLGRAPTEPSLLAPAEIARFYVAREWHGRGVARSLMAACESEARRRGAGTLWLGVWQRNPRAIAFYRRCGFVTVGVAKFHFGTDLQDDYVMARDLASTPVSSP